MSTVQETLRLYRSYYEVLAPDERSVRLAQELWYDWESQGTSAPDVKKIAEDLEAHERGFFEDIVRICEKHAGNPLQAHYCPFCLSDYNFYAFSASDGYVVLVDDNFFQLLFFLCIVLVYYVYEDLPIAEEAEAVGFIHKLIKNNYIERRRMSVKDHDILQRLMSKNYEYTEFANYLFHSLKAFIVAHELGHHALGHTKGTTQRTFSMNGNSRNIDVDERSIADEYAADDFACAVLHTLHRTVDDSVPYAFCKYRFDFAPALLFDVFHSLDRAAAKMGHVIRYNDHPHPEDRIKALVNGHGVNTEDELYLELSRSLSSLIPVG